MPREVRTKEEFEKLMASATEIRVKRSEDSAKLKLRLKKELFTFKTTLEDADSIVKGTKFPVSEI